MNKTDIVIIRNNRPTLIYLPSAAGTQQRNSGQPLKTARAMTRDMRKLNPGDNEVPLDLWTLVKGNRSVQIWLAAGWLVVRDPAPASALAPAPTGAGAGAPTGSLPPANPHLVDPGASVPLPVLLTDIDEEECLKLIRNVTDLEVIERWGASEQREDIVKALLDRYTELGGT